MATKKPFIARHGINVGSTVVFGSNGKLHANNVISNGTITDDMLSGSTGSNLSKVQQVESNLLATNTAIRAITTANATEIGDVWSGLIATNTAIRSLVTSNDSDISSLQTEDGNLWSAITSTNTAVRSYTDTAVANLVDSAPATLDTLNELAAALGDDANFATTVSTNLGQRLGATATVTLTGAVTGSASFSSNAVSISTTATSDPTLTLSGDASGSATFTNLGNATLSLSVNDNAIDAAALNVSGNGTSGQYLASDGDGSFTWTTLSTDPSMGGDISGTASNAQIVANAVGASELNVSGNGTTSQFLRSDGDGTFTWATPTDTNTTYSAGTGMSLSGTTFSIGQAVGTSNDVRFDSFGVGTNASGTTGQIRATNSIVAYYSDDRLKTRQGNIENAVEKVMSLNGFYYTENETAKSLGYDNDNVQVGVSAQEVEAILPEIIEDAPINANFEGADYKTLMYDKLVPLLVEAIKEQQNQIDELKGIINNK